MVIMSDMESFSLKFGCIFLAFFSLSMVIAYVKETSKIPDVVYRDAEPIVESDTVFVKDTIYIVQQSVQDVEPKYVSDDTERVDR